MILAYLTNHRVNDVDKGLVAVEQAVATAEDVALEPALNRVLRQHLHDAAGRGQVAAVLVLVKVLAHPYLLGDLVDGAELVGLGLVGAEEAEVLGVLGHDVAQEERHVLHAAALVGGRAVKGDGVLAEVGHLEGLLDDAAVGDGVGAHAADALGAEGLQGLVRGAVLVEQAVGLVAAHPLLEDLEVLRVGGGARDGHLVGAPEALEVLAVDLARGAPALGGAQDDHGPARAGGLAGLAGLLLDLADLADGVLHGGGHGLVHGGQVVALDEERLPAVADEEVADLVMGDAGQDGGVVDLVAVEVDDGQDGAVGDGVEELGAVPGRGQGARLGLAVADRGQGDEVRVVVDGAEGVRDRVSQLAALVDGAGRLGRGVGADAAGEGEPLEEALHALDVERLVRVDLGIHTLEVRLGEDGGGAVAGAGDEEGIEVVLLDEAVHVHVGEDLAGGGAVVAEQAGLEVLLLEGLAQQRVLLEVDHAQGEVAAGVEEVIVDLDLLLGEGIALDGRAGRAKGRERLDVVAHVAAG